MQSVLFFYCCFLYFYSVFCLSGSGTVQQRQTWGRKAPGFGLATFRWASCIIVQQGSSLGSSPTFPSLNPHYNRPSGHWPGVKSCLVGGSGKYRIFIICIRCVFFPYGFQIFLRWNSNGKLKLYLLTQTENKWNVNSHCYSCLGIQNTLIPESFPCQEWNGNHHLL